MTHAGNSPAEFYDCTSWAVDECTCGWQGDYCACGDCPDSLQVDRAFTEPEPSSHCSNGGAYRGRAQAGAGCGDATHWGVTTYNTYCQAP
jgi:hypothetical protein